VIGAVDCVTEPSNPAYECQDAALEDTGIGWILSQSSKIVMVRESDDGDE